MDRKVNFFHADSTVVHNEAKENFKLRFKLKIKNPKSENTLDLGLEIYKLFLVISR